MRLGSSIRSTPTSVALGKVWEEMASLIYPGSGPFLEYGINAGMKP
jgi:hypothetical protein